MTQNSGSLFQQFPERRVERIEFYKTRSTAFPASLGRVCLAWPRCEAAPRQASTPCAYVCLGVPRCRPTPRHHVSSHLGTSAKLGKPVPKGPGNAVDLFLSQTSCAIKYFFVTLPESLPERSLQRHWWERVHISGRETWRGYVKIVTS
jgi:hypothetical protein